MKKKTLQVFAASSLTESFGKLQKIYEKSHPGVKLEYNFDSSGTLQTQIEAGADCDVFVSASPKQMNELKKDIKEETRVALLENQVVLAVPKGNPADIYTFGDLKTDKLNLLAIGNNDVPVGQYSREILEFLDCFDTLDRSMKITYGSNAKEVTTQVSKNLVDAGIVFQTDAVAAGLKIVDVADVEKGMCSQAMYMAAVLGNSSIADEASDFIEFLKSDEAQDVFEEFGFTSLNEEGE